MLAEPLVDIPGDLREGWFAVPVPAGRRCLVISSKNSTVARLRNGAVLNKFVSALPSGSPGSRYAGRREGRREEKRRVKGERKKVEMIMICSGFPYFITSLVFSFSPWLI